jgi:hypothetical protein
VVRAQAPRCHVLSYDLEHSKSGTALVALAFCQAREHELREMD